MHRRGSDAPPSFACAGDDYVDTTSVCRTSHWPNTTTTTDNQQNATPPATGAEAATSTCSSSKPDPPSFLTLPTGELVNSKNTSRFIAPPATAASSKNDSNAAATHRTYKPPSATDPDNVFIDAHIVRSGSRDDVVAATLPNDARQDHNGIETKSTWRKLFAAVVLVCIFAVGAAVGLFLSSFYTNTTAVNTTPTLSPTKQLVPTPSPSFALLPQRKPPSTPRRAPVTSMLNGTVAPAMNTTPSVTVPSASRPAMSAAPATPVPAVSSMPSSHIVAPQAPLAVNDSRSAAIVAFINQITLSGRSIVYDPKNIAGEMSGYPEERALQWLIDIDPMQLMPNTTANQLKLTQRYALLTLCLQHPLLENELYVSTVPVNFSMDTCKWRPYITCRDLHIDNGTGIQSVVTKVNYTDAGGDFFIKRWQELSPGSQSKIFLTADIGLLSSLEHMEIHTDFLAGSLPSTVGRWKSITRIDLSSSSMGKLTGSLPASIGNWSNARSIDLSSNALTGSLPSTIGHWTSLEFFSVRSNKLTGSLTSSIGNWRNVQHLDLSNNKFAGSLPMTIGKWTSLEVFSVKNNQFTGAVPSSLGNWVNATFVRLAFNGMVGSLPTTIGQLTLLESFSVTANQLTGHIPDSIVSWTNLQEAYFYNNSFVGTVPSGLCNFTSLSLLSSDCVTGVTCDCCTECH